MKLRSTLRQFIPMGLSLLLFLNISAQTARPVWTSNLNSTFKNFIENKGHFSEIEGRKVLYSFIGNNEKYFFTEKGLIIRLDSVIRKKGLISKIFSSEEEKREKFSIRSYYLFAEWQNTQDNVEIETTGKSEEYYTFGLSQETCGGFKKITYKNIYPDVDIVYTLPDDKNGIKYNIVLHPGADLSGVSLKYSGDVNDMFADNQGNIIIKTPMQEITEHAPETYYSANLLSLGSSFVLNNNEISFYLPQYDVTQEVTIDPWVSGILISGDDWGYDVDYDFTGNLYVYVRAYSAAVLYVKKFSPAGAALWTHTITTDFTYEGNFMVDRLANKIYISEGFNALGARAYRIGANGVADGFISAQNGNFREMWDMTFDCNFNRVFGMGGGTSSNLNGGLINTGTGAVTVSNFTGIAGTCQDISCQTIDNQGRLYVVYAKTTDVVSVAVDDKISLINNTLNGYVWMVPHGMWGFSECSTHPPDYSCFGPGSNAFNGLDVNDSYLYYYDGGGLATYVPATGAQITATSVGYSGTWYTPINQGGIAVDDCNNIYLGGPNSNILTSTFNGSSFSAFANVPLGWGTGQVFDIKYDRNTNYLFISGRNNVGVFNASLSSSCINNSISNTTVCTGPQTGSATVTVVTTLPNPVITYTWYDSGGSVISQTPGSTSLTNTVTGLANGTYVVNAQINPACGPMVIDTIVIFCPTCGGAVTTTPVSCFGGNNGTATVTPSGGVAPYTYVWSPGNPTGQGTASISNLIAGTYTVVVTDGNNCTATTSGTVTEPTSLTATTSSTAVTCFGGSDGTATVSPAGGTWPYSEIWTGGQSGVTATNLTANTYNVTVTDANNCTTLQSAIITQPPQLVITATATPASVCPGASSTLTASNADTYVWSPATGLSSTTGASVTASPMSTTTYYVTGTDVNGCTATTQVTLTITGAPVITTTGTPAICEGQSSTITASGGVSYVWDAGQPTASINVTPLVTTTYYVTGTDANGCLGTANYTVSVTAMPVANAGPDAAYCQLTADMQATASVGTGIWTVLSGGNVTFSPVNSPTSTITVGASGTYTLIWTENNGNGCIDSDTVTIQLTQTPTSDFTATAIPCTGNASNVTYTGTGSSLCTYTWNFGGGTAIPGTGMGPHSVTWLSTGTQTVSLTVTLNGCSSPPTSVDVLNPTPLTSTISGTNILCYGQTNGSAVITPAGGTPPYQYIWSNFSTSQVLQGVAGAIYTVTVTDFNGCTTFNGITIIEPDKFIISTNPNHGVCYGQPAYLNVSLTGGTGPAYTYLWSTLQTSPSITVYPTPPSETYSVTATDANGCTASATVTVSVSPPININLIANTDSVCPGEPVMLTPVITGGVGPPYMIINQDGAVVTPPVYVYPETSGLYWVSVKDACGTTSADSVYLYVLPLPAANAYPDSLAGCQPFTVHFNEVNPEEGRTFVWDFGDNENLSLAKNPVHTYTRPGVFNVTLTVTSQYGCKAIYNICSITVWPKPNAQFVWTPQFASVLKPILNFTNMTTGGQSYIWTFGDGDSTNTVHPVHRFPGAGDWPVELIAISDKGCRDTVLYPITIQDEWTFYAPTAFTPDFDKKNDYFYALAHGIKKEGFYLAVYDRWGEVIWETDIYDEVNEKSEMWDGKAKNNELVQVGTYTWLAIFKDFKGIRHEKTGAVTVVR